MEFHDFFILENLQRTVVFIFRGRNERRMSRNIDLMRSSLNIYERKKC
jgi:hypothetical protein